MSQAVKGITVINELNFTQNNKSNLQCNKWRYRHNMKKLKANITTRQEKGNNDGYDDDDDDDDDDNSNNYNSSIIIVIIETSSLFYIFQEFPFFTITMFPAGFLRHIGGVVTARSVKLLDKINHPGTCTNERSFCLVP